MVRPHLSFMVRASIILEMAAFSTYFFDEMNVFQAHFFIDSLAHVVNREQGRRHAGQGLHFDAGLAVALDGAAAFYFTDIVMKNKFDAAFCKV